MTTKTYNQEEGLPIFTSEGGGDDGLPIFNEPVKKKVGLEGYFLRSKQTQKPLLADQSDLGGLSISKPLSGKDRITAETDYIKNIEKDIYNTVDNFRAVTVQNGDAGGRSGGNEYFKKDLFKINLDNPQEYASLVETIRNADYLEAKGKNLTGKKKEEMLEALDNRAKFITSKKGITKTISQLKPEIEQAIVSTIMESDRGEGQQSNPADDEQKLNHFKLGLSHIENTNPNQFNNVLQGIARLRKVNESDFTEISYIGQQIANMSKFRAGAYDPAWQGTETNFDYTTYGQKKAKAAAVIGEKLKEKGYKNQNQFTRTQIEEAAKEAGVENQSIVQDLIKEEKIPFYDAIPKSGWMDDVASGIMQPIAGIKNTMQTWGESPAETYLRSKRLDEGIGGQKVPDEKGEYSDILPSERDDWKTGAFRGLGQFIPQVVLSKGVGSLANKALSTTGAALNAAQQANVVNYLGTGISTYLQTYGQEYQDALNRTGDPKLSSLLANIDSGFTAGWEMLLPDVKIAQRSFDGVKKVLTNDLADLIKKGGNPAELATKARPYIQKAVTEISSIWGKEISEEVGTNFTDYLTELVFSPASAKERDLGKEMGQTLKAAATATLFPALLGGGMSGLKKDFTVNTLHSAAINFNDYKNSLEKSFADGEISRDDFNKTLGLLQTHKTNIESAAQVDETGNAIPEEKQLEAAFNKTVEDVKLLDEVRQKASLEEQASDINYFIQKAGESPSQYYEKYGVETTNKLLQSVPTETLKSNLNTLLDINPENPNVAVLDKLIEQREPSEVTEEEFKGEPEQISQPIELSVEINKQNNLNLQDNAKESENISIQENKGIADSTQSSTQESPEKIQKRYERVISETDITDPFDVVLNHFASGGKIHSNAIAELFGGKDQRINQRTSTENERRAKISIIGKDALSIDELAHSLWESDKTGKYDTQDYKNAIESVLLDFNSKSAMQQALSEKYDIEAAYEKYAQQQMGGEAIDIVEKLTEEEIDEILRMEAESKTGEELQSYLDTLIESTPTQEAVGELPPTVPPVEVEAPRETPNNPKAILNRVFDSKNISEATKGKLEKEGLSYVPKTHEEARTVAKDIVKEFGVDASISMAEAGRFAGDVNSLIFAEGIDQTFLAEQSATTQEEKIKLAEQWADYAIRYDKTAREKGRFISAVFDFYRKSPLGVLISERAKRDEAFKEWFDKREKPYREVFDAIKEEPEFKDLVKEKVTEALKQERATNRMKRRQKIADIFDKGKIKKDQLSSSIIPPQVWNAAVEVMKQTFLAGESIVDTIQKGVDYIKENYTEAWDEKAFRDEWNERLTGADGKQVKTDEDTIKKKQEKLIERFRKKLSGLNESQKEDVIRRSFKKLVEAGALEYDDFKKIIADTLGLGEMSPEEVTMLSGFIQDMNNVQDLQDKVLSATDEAGIKAAISEFDKGAKKAEGSATKLAGMLYNKPKIAQRVRSIIQLNTLGLTSLIKNPFYNIFHQLLVRLPKGVFMTLLDQTIYGASLLGNKLFGNPVIRPDVNILLAQKGYFSKGKEGGKQAIQQVFTGLTNKDYFQKEVYNAQIKPFKSWRDLFAWAKNDKALSKEQIADKVIQGTVGIPAEIVARFLNIGDKPFRYAAEAAIAETIATQEFKLTGIERERFLRFPKDVAKKIYLSKGLSEEAANKKAEDLEKRIIREGEEAVFQQENFISERLNKLKQDFKTDEDSHPMSKFADGLARAFGVLNMPFVKTPINVGWEVLNLVVPEIALAQAAAYSYKAYKNGSRLDYIQAKKWMAHAAVGWSLMGALGYLASIGAISGGDEDEDYKAKEAKGKATYQKPRRLNMSKFLRALGGGSTEDEDNDLNIDLSWFGAPGMIMNMQANRYENMTKEEREGMAYTDDLLMRLHTGSSEGLTNSVFQGTLTAVDAIRSGNTNNWMLNMMNVGTNFIEPATIAQLSRATRPYDYQIKADDFPQTIKNNLKSRFFGNPPAKVNIWGDKVKRDNSFAGVAFNMLGFSRYDKNAIGEPIFQDFKRTGDSDFFPSDPKPEITVDGETKKMSVEQATQFRTLVGQARKQLANPFVSNAATMKGKYYDNMTDEQKIESLKKLYKQGYDAGKKQFIQLYPEFKN